MMFAIANIGEMMVKGLAWMSAALFLVGLAGKIVSARNPQKANAGRACWLMGSIVFLVHVLMAMGGFFAWSFETAQEVAALNTFDFIKVRSGVVIYANFFFTLLWLADALWWRLGMASYRQRPVWLAVFINGFLGIMVFGGCVVLVVNPLRWVILAGFMGVAALALKTRPTHS